MIQQLRQRPRLLREVIGEVLRELRIDAGLTLRELSARALVSLGYLSEVERGRKEASSEMLQSICEANGITLIDLLQLVSKHLEEQRAGRVLNPMLNRVAA